MTEREPIGPEEQAALQAAGEQIRHVMKATKVAAFNGWSVGFFAGVSLLFGLFSFTSLVIGIGLGIVAWNEFRGRKQLRALQPSGLELLWRNQVGFMALIIVYCLWSIYSVTARPDPGMTELTDLLGSGTGDLVRDLTILVYAVVIVVTALFQGLNARFYKVRVEQLENYLEETPQWILDVQRASVID
jgi:hypothetical protein